MRNGFTQRRRGANQGFREGFSKVKGRKEQDEETGISSPGLQAGAQLITIRL